VCLCVYIYIYVIIYNKHIFAYVINLYKIINEIHRNTNEENKIDSHRRFHLTVLIIADQLRYNMIWNRAGYLAPIRFASKPACRWWPSAAIISRFKQASGCRIRHEFPNDGRNLVVAARPHDSIRFWLPKVQVEAAEITARYPDFCPAEMCRAAGVEHYISICQIDRNV